LGGSGGVGGSAPSSWFQSVGFGGDDFVGMLR